MAREIRYIKPNMNNLRGKTGEAVIRELMNAKAPDDSAQRALVEKIKAEVLAKRMDAK